MGRRWWGALFSCAVTMTVLSGCATGTLNAPDSGVTGPTVATTVTGSTTAEAAASAAEQSRRAAAAAHAASSRAAESRSAADPSDAQDSAADQSTVEHASSEAVPQPAQGDDPATQDSANAAVEDALAHGWYDEHGWVSPTTAARALAAGIPPGANVPDHLRCGTLCGEEPTSAEIQAQQSAEQSSAQAQATSTSAPCAYMVVRGVCYTTPAEASAAGE